MALFECTRYDSASEYIYKILFEYVYEYYKKIDYNNNYKLYLYCNYYKDNNKINKYEINNYTDIIYNKNEIYNYKDNHIYEKDCYGSIFKFKLRDFIKFEEEKIIKTLKEYYNILYYNIEKKIFICEKKYYNNKYIYSYKNEDLAYHFIYGISNEINFDYDDNTLYIGTFKLIEKLYKEGYLKGLLD